MRLPRLHLLKFSLAELLGLTLAVGLALAASTRWTEWGLRVPFGPGRLALVDGLMTLGSTLLALELFRHGKQILSQGREGKCPVAWHFKLAAINRWLVAGGIVLLSFIAIVTRRLGIETSPFDDVLVMAAELWPEFLPFLLALVAVKLLVNDSGARKPAGHFGSMITPIVLLAMVAYSCFVLMGVLGWAAYLHAITGDIELSQPLRWQRPGTFPDVRASESSHFWLCGAAFATLLTAIALQIAYCSKPMRIHRATLASLFVISLTVVGLFDLWYLTAEFPRISPDLATASIEPTPWVIVAVILLALGLAHYVGVAAARQIVKVESPPPATIQTHRGWLSALGAMAVVASALLFLLGLTVFGFGEIFSNRPWDRPNHFFERGEFDRLGRLLIIPDLIPLLVLLPSCVTLLTQKLRQPQLTIHLLPIRLRDYLLHFGATIALLLVGIPSLRAFGFALWIGPI